MSDLKTSPPGESEFAELIRQAERYFDKPYSQWTPEQLELFSKRAQEWPELRRRLQGAPEKRSKGRPRKVADPSVEDVRGSLADATPQMVLGWVRGMKATMLREVRVLAKAEKNPRLLKAPTDKSVVERFLREHYTTHGRFVGGKQVEVTEAAIRGEASALLQRYASAKRLRKLAAERRKKGAERA